MGRMAAEDTYRSIFRPGLFAGQSIVVTGGGSGIGRCTAHELASLGAHAALVGRKLEPLETVAQEITDAGGSASAHQCDIRDEETVAQTISAVVTDRGRIDGLVNNAGGQFPAPLATINQKGWETVVRTNLTGGFLMARECYTQYMNTHGGAIVNIVADMWNGMVGMGHSGAARAGMVNFTETAANEWAVSGVRVNAVAPGWIASSGLDKYDPNMAEHFKTLHENVPLQRLGTESEVSAAIVFLMSEAAGFISGVCLRVDGAAPNARRHTALPKHDTSEPFDGFHLASLPEVLRK